MQVLKIQFTDFWDGFVPEKSFFWELLSRKYCLQLSNEPDILIYTSFGRSHVNYRCLKIFWTGENVRPDFSKCDFALTFDEHSKNGKNYRMPLYVYYAHAYGYSDLSCIIKNNKELNRENTDAVNLQKTKFCNMLVSNSNRDKIVVDFFHKLSKYKVVDSGGRYLNNIGGPVPDKLQFIKNYKFTLAFENSLYPGYTTEKIFEPMLVGSIPIYWGNPNVSSEFNPKSFINLHDFATFDDAIQRIIEIDQDDELYNCMMSEPFIYYDSIPKYLTNEAILEYFSKIIDNRKSFKPVSCTWQYYPPYLIGKLKDVRISLLRLLRPDNNAL